MDQKNKKNGLITRVAGPVVDVRFEGEIPAVNEALEVTLEKGKKLILEVAFENGDSQVRALALASTDGLVRGMQVSRTGAPIKVPVGNQTLGKIFNVLGETTDGSKIDTNCPST